MRDSDEVQIVGTIPISHLDSSSLGGAAGICYDQTCNLHPIRSEEARPPAMVASDDSAQSDGTVQQYQAEMQLMRAELQTTVMALDMPLRGLVQARVNTLWPEMRAAIVLAAGVPAGDNTDADQDQVEKCEQVRAQRVHLAAALEMLAAAMSIHKLLLGDEAADLDKSVLGGTILAGDYCFSCSAAMAVKTENPEVVKLFSEALKRVSEGNLRDIFVPSQKGNSAPEPLISTGQARDLGAPFNDDLEFFRAGVIAATVLAEQPVDSAQPTLDFVNRLANAQHRKGDTPANNQATLYALIADLPVHQRPRWRHLLIWLFDGQSSAPDKASALL